MPVPLPAALAPGLSDHLCHAYDGVHELRGSARPYLLAGIALGQRPLVVAPARQSWANWEHAVGQWQSLRPVASACCFDRGVLGDKAVQELACLHPRVLTTGPVVPFRLYFRGGQLVLEGEVDSFTAPLLAHAVTHVHAAPGERLMIDARGLTFLNHRGLTTLV